MTFLYTLRERDVSLSVLPDREGSTLNILMFFLVVVVVYKFHTCVGSSFSM